MEAITLDFDNKGIVLRYRHEEYLVTETLHWSTVYEHIKPFLMRDIGVVNGL